MTWNNIDLVSVKYLRVVLLRFKGRSQSSSFGLFLCFALFVQSCLCTELTSCWALSVLSSLCVELSLCWALFLLNSISMFTSFCICKANACRPQCLYIDRSASWCEYFKKKYWKACLCQNILDHTSFAFVSNRIDSWEAKTDKSNFKFRQRLLASADI